MNVKKLCKDMVENEIAEVKHDNIKNRDTYRILNNKGLNIDINGREISYVTAITIDLENPTLWYELGDNFISGFLDDNVFIISLSDVEDDIYKKIEDIQEEVGRLDISELDDIYDQLGKLIK